MSEDILENELNQEELERLEKERQEQLERERLELERQQEIERQEQERLEQERIEAEEKAREQARIEHENFLNSFPETTVFYQELKEEGDVKWLCGTVKDAHTAESYGWLDNHYDESELTYVGTPECGIWYLKGYEKPDKTEAELIAEKANQIDKELEALLDATVQQRNYKNVESCVSYFNSTDDKYRTEAIAVNRWRDDLYRTAQNTLDKVRSGDIDWHTVDLDYIVSQVDPLDW